jgi:hypothetical protein
MFPDGKTHNQIYYIPIDRQKKSSVLDVFLENVNILAKESLGYCELKKYKPWFNEGSSK